MEKMRESASVKFAELWSRKLLRGFLPSYVLLRWQKTCRGNSINRCRHRGEKQQLRAGSIDCDEESSVFRVAATGGRTRGATSGYQHDDVLVMEAGKLPCWQQGATPSQFIIYWIIMVNGHHRDTRVIHNARQFSTYDLRDNISAISGIYTKSPCL